MLKINRKLYIGLAVNTLHHEHTNLINQASSCVKLTLGLLTDNAIILKKRISVFNYKQKKISKQLNEI